MASPTSETVLETAASVTMDTVFTKICMDLANDAMPASILKFDPNVLFPLKSLLTAKNARCKSSMESTTILRTVASSCNVDTISIIEENALGSSADTVDKIFAAVPDRSTNGSIIVLKVLETDDKVADLQPLIPSKLV